AVVLIACPAVLDNDIAALDEAALLETAAKRLQQVHRILGRTRAHESDHRHRRLLGACCKRPRTRAAEQSDERAPLHSITSSARARKDSGIVRPIAFAALTLTTSSNLVAWSTGRSAGDAPLRMRPTWTPARR